MTFDSIVNANEEAFGVKVSFGDEIRRAPFSGTTYVALLELVTKLFDIEQASAVLKYQDEDGDHITVSSDSELQEAIQLAKAKKTLRLFVATKPTEAQAEVRSVEQPPLSPANFWNHGPFPGPFHRGGFRGGFRGNGDCRGGFRGGFRGFGDCRGAFRGHHGRHSPHFGPASENENENENQNPNPTPNPATPGESGSESRCPMGGFFGGPFGGFAGHPYPRFGYGRFGPHGHEHGEHGHKHGHHGHKHGHKHGHTDDDIAAHYGAPSVFAHGTFSAADSVPAATFASASDDGSQDWEAARRAFKAKKHAMRDTIRKMKANATTPEDAQAIRDYKEGMKAEWKGAWKGFRHCHKNADRLSAKHVADVTIPDNSELPADTPVTKTWKLKNAGDVAWPADSQLIFVSRCGDNLNGPERVAVEGPVLPQQEVDVSVTFITPSEPGRYIGYYRMATADGGKFGQRVWVSFVIPSPASAPKGAAPLPARSADAADDVTMD